VNLTDLHDWLPDRWFVWLLDKLGLTDGYRWLMFEVLEQLDETLWETAA
jgi:hypothetical protein